MCCEVVLCYGIVGWRETRRSVEKTMRAAAGTTRMPCAAGIAVHAASAAASTAHPPWQLADDNLVKAQTAGLQLNRLHALIAWRRRVLHRTADAKAPELHEANARLTDLLAKC